MKDLSETGRYLMTNDRTSNPSLRAGLGFLLALLTLPMMATPTELSGAATGDANPQAEVPPVIAEGLAALSARELESGSAVKAEAARERVREVEIFLDSANALPRLEAAK
jgi:hypothetical protein